MKAYELLRDLQLGEETAENEQRLADYFIKTTSFDLFVDGDYDLCLGPKGSGKSAIARYVTDPKVLIPELSDVMIIPAFNVESSPLFESLATDLADASEDLLRVLFTAYMVSLVGNRLLQLNSPVDRSELARLLDEAGLGTGRSELHTVWKRVVHWARRLRPRRVSTSLGVDPSGHTTVTGSIDFSVPSDRAEIGANHEGPTRLRFANAMMAEILRETIKILGELRQRCWIIFDRLDEAFLVDRNLERIALRGLLRAHMNICTYGHTLRPKLFLRSDLYDRITEQSGFVNASHLRRSILDWNYDSLTDLIFQRVVTSQKLRRIFNIPRRVDNDRARRTQLMKLLPSAMDGRNTITWMFAVTTDGTEQPNPRNVLTLLREARQHAMQSANRNDEDFETYKALIPATSLTEGRRKVSEARLYNNIYAEFNHLRPHVERLQGPIGNFTRRRLASRLKLPADSPKLTDAIEDLVYAGVLRRQAGDVYVIAELFKPVMHVATADAVPDEPEPPTSRTRTTEPAPRLATSTQKAASLAKKPRPPKAS